MNLERTLSIIKPDAVKKNIIGKIINKFEENNIRIIKIKMVTLSIEEAGNFYKVHKGKPFYLDLINFISSGPIVVQILEGEDVIKKNREIMGSTNPALAKKGTIRYEFASSIDQNAVHGSDSSKTAKEEINFFFKGI